MPYTILADRTTYALIIRDIDNSHNSLTVANLAEAITLRNRLTDFINTLEPDKETTIEVSAPTPLAYISTQAAAELAESYGYELKPNTLRMAIIRGTVKGQKHGGRWVVERNDFITWLRHLMPATP
jgi:hypothetical protein